MAYNTIILKVDDETYSIIILKVDDVQLHMADSSFERKKYVKDLQNLF